MEVNEIGKSFSFRKSKKKVKKEAIWEIWSELLKGSGRKVLKQKQVWQS